MKDYKNFVERMVSFDDEIDITNTELYHFGIKGMHWGIRKANIAKKHEEYKNKVSTISKKLEKSGDNETDAKMIKYANQSVHKRVGESIGMAIASTLISDVLRGEVKNYGHMSKAEIIAKTIKITKSAATNIALREALSRSVVNKYDKSGRKVKGKNNPFITREEAISTGITIGMQVAPLAKTAVMIKGGQINKRRRQNYETYKSRGINLLSDKTNSFVNANYTVK